MLRFFLTSTVIIASALGVARTGFAEYVDVVKGTAGLVSYWRLGETGTVVDGVTAAADSYGSNGGTYYTTTTLGQTGIPGTVAEPDTAALFDGSTGRVSVPDNSSLNPGTGAFSVELWVRTDDYDPTARPELLEKQERSSGTKDLYQIWQNYSVMHFGCKDVDGGTGSDASASTPASFLDDGEWHHIVGVRKLTGGTGDAGELEIWIDGLNKDQTDYSSAFNITPATPLLIAKGNGGNFPGVIDEVAYYSVALSESTIQQHYNTGIVPEPSTFVLLAIAGLGLLLWRWRRR